MQVVRKAWTEPKKWDWDGTYYKVERGDVHPKPYTKPHSPFYFGGASEAGKKVGAEDADVYLLWGETLDMVRERIADMRERASAAGRTLRFGMRIHVIARETEDEAWAAANDIIAKIPEGFQSALDKIQSRTDSEGEKRQQQMREAAGGEDLVIAPNLWTGIGKARVGVGTALVGSGENIAKRLQEYIDEGIDTFILSGYPHLEEAQRFGTYVMPFLAFVKPSVHAGA
jgi:alkanesulfonate monooxygenase